MSPMLRKNMSMILMKKYESNFDEKIELNFD